MSKLDDAWINIKDSLEALTRPKPDGFSPEYAQAMSRVLHGMSKLKGDVDYFLNNAPPGDSRRAGVLRLKELMAKMPGS
jgi:hypothetical protein